MKKKLMVVLLFGTLFMSACSDGGTTAETTGVVDCYSISVKNGGSTIYGGSYQVSYSSVYEYKNEKGNSVYTYDNIGTVLFVYPDRYTKEYTEYEYVGFIGWLTKEKNYYLDLTNRVIDEETKWSEYFYSSNPDTSTKADNKRAYNCAKKSYYRNFDYTYSDDGMTIYHAIKLDTTEKDLEEHTYTKLGEDSVITYKAKWF